MPTRIRVSLAKVGTVGHDRGVKIVARTLRDADMDVVYTGLHRSPDEAVAEMRGSVMADADVIITPGRRLDLQRACGSPAVMGNARFIRIADAPSELRDKRRGEVEMLAQPKAALAMLQTHLHSDTVLVSTAARSSDGIPGLAWVPDLQAVQAWDKAELAWRQPAR